MCQSETILFQDCFFTISRQTIFKYFKLPRRQSVNFEKLKATRKLILHGWMSQSETSKRQRFGWWLRTFFAASSSRWFYFLWNCSPLWLCRRLAGKLQETANDRFCEKLRFLSRVQFPPVLVCTVHMYCAVYTCTVVSRPGDSQGSTCHTGQLQTTGGRCAADMNMGPITGSWGLSRAGSVKQNNVRSEHVVRVCS